MCACYKLHHAHLYWGLSVEGAKGGTTCTGCAVCKECWSSCSRTAATAMIPPDTNIDTEAVSLWIPVWVFRHQLQQFSMYGGIGRVSPAPFTHQMTSGYYGSVRQQNNRVGHRNWCSCSNLRSTGYFRGERGGALAHIACSPPGAESLW